MDTSVVADQQKSKVHQLFMDIEYGVENLWGWLLTESQSFEGICAVRVPWWR